MDEAGEFEAFVGSKWRTLVSAAIRLGHGLDEAEDIAQSTLVQCYVKWDRVRRADDLDAYVYRILINLHRSRRRRDKRRADVPILTDTSASGSERPLDQHFGASALSAALGGLTLKAREVVVLRIIEDLSERQTADVLGIPPGTVKSRLSRALSALRLDPSLRAALKGVPDE